MTEKENKSNQEQSLTQNEDLTKISQDDEAAQKKVKKKKIYRKRDKSKLKERTYGILIVEDEKSWSNVYKINLVRKLEQKRKFQIYEAKNSKEAIKILIQYNDRIDIVLLDLVIGEQTGDKPEGMLLLETIVERLGLTDLGIFVITAYATKSLEEQCHIRGVRYFLDKSQLDFERLSNLIDDYIELIDQPKGRDVGFYIESRSQKGQRYLYLRWKYGEGDWDMEYLGNANEIKRIVLPNIITDLNDLEGWKPVEPEIEEKE